MPAAPVTRVSRRTLLTGGTLGLGVGLAAGLVGCAGGEADQGRSGDAAGAATAGGGPAPSPDVRLASRALEEVRGTRALLDQVTDRFPGLGAALAPVAAMHAAHDLALADAIPARPDELPGASGARRPVPGARPAALAALADREEALRDRLAELALEAESGAFAQLLAAMSAGVAQQVARWPA